MRRMRVALVEVIEHLDVDRLPALEEVVFGEGRPETVVLTTPNRDYNALFPELAAGSFRHPDHRFEWSRQEMEAWAGSIEERYGYRAAINGIGDGHPEFGAPDADGRVQPMNAGDPTLIDIPDFSLVVLIGATGAGKSTFASRWFRPTEVVSSDTCRAMVSDDADRPVRHERCLRPRSGNRGETAQEPSSDGDRRDQCAGSRATGLGRDRAPVACACPWQSCSIRGSMCASQRNKRRPESQLRARRAAAHDPGDPQGIEGSGEEGFRQVWRLSSQEGDRRGTRGAQASLDGPSRRSWSL